MTTAEEMLSADSIRALPFYRHMFAEAGHPVPEDGTLPDALIDSLVVSGDQQTIAARLRELCQFLSRMKHRNGPSYLI